MGTNWEEIGRVYEYGDWGTARAELLGPPSSPNTAKVLVTGIVKYLSFSIPGIRKILADLARFSLIINGVTTYIYTAIFTLRSHACNPK